jgi:hypothetical protein
MHASGNYGKGMAPQRHRCQTRIAQEVETRSQIDHKKIIAKEQSSCVET